MQRRYGVECKTISEVFTYATEKQIS